MILKKWITFAFLILLAGCVKLPEDVIAPSWDTEFNIPITNKTYQLSDIIKPQKYVEVNPDSSYSFSSDDYEYSSDVSEFLDKSDKSVFVEAGSIPSNNITANIYLPFPDSIKLVKAVYKEGVLDFHALNKSNSDYITVNMQIPGLKDFNGNILQSQLILAPGDSGTSSMLLNDYEYSKPNSQSSALDNAMLIETTVSSGSVLAEADVSFKSARLKFKSVTGYFPPRSLQPFNHTVELKLGNDITGYRGNIYLTDAFLNLRTRYVTSGGNPFQMKLNDLNITAVNLQGNQQKPLLFKTSANGNSVPSISFPTGLVDTVFNGSNSSITDFVAFLPDEMVITASPVMNPDDDTTYRTVAEDDEIKIESSISTKGYDLSGETTSAMAIRRSTLKDTLELSMDQSNRDALKDGRGADISIQVTNAIPLNTWFKIILADQNYNELSSLTTNNNGSDSLEFTGAQVSSLNGNVTGTSRSEQMINLNSSQIQALANAYYIIVTMSLETSSFSESDPVHVLLKANDWVEINVKGRINYNINLNN
jgi:hypothetical protein